MPFFVHISVDVFVSIKKIFTLNIYQLYNPCHSINTMNSNGLIHAVYIGLLSLNLIFFVVTIGGGFGICSGTIFLLGLAITLTSFGKTETISIGKVTGSLIYFGVLHWVLAGWVSYQNSLSFSDQMLNGYFAENVSSLQAFIGGLVSIIAACLIFSPLNLSREALIPVLACSTIVGVGMILVGFSMVSDQSSTSVNESQLPVLSNSLGQPPLPSVTISADGNKCSIVVPSDQPEGVKAIDKTGKKFVITAGDDVKMELSGRARIGSDRAVVTPAGETGYRDPYVDSPFKDRVGGLEFSIGSLSDNRYLAAANSVFRAKHTGVPVFRVIETKSGYHDGNLGYFTVVITKKR